MNRSIKTELFHEAAPVFFICLGIGFALALMQIVGTTELQLIQWLRVLAAYIIFSELIGFSNLLTCNLLPSPDRIANKVWRQIYLAGEFTVGSLVGTFLAMRTTSWLFGIDYPKVGLAKFFLIVLGFSLVAAYGIYFYLVLKGRLEGAAAALQEKQVFTERLEKLKTAAELSALQAKIQPHFLFNTLNSIAALIREDPALAEATTEKLAELFRHVLESNRREYIALSEEMEIVAHYLEIEKLRLGERLRYRIDLEPALADVPVPGLLIQPLVENSIKHGIAPLEEGGEIVISAKATGSTVALTVQDNGTGYDPNPGRADVGARNGYGLQNIRDRLANLYGSAAQFKVHSRVGEGTRVEITLPMKAGHA